MWCVVNFTEENAVEVVPKSWIIAESMQCYWPHSFNRKRIIEAVKDKESPGCTWHVFRVRILGTYDDLLLAQIKCNRAKDRDDLSTSSDELSLGRGLRFKKNKNLSDYVSNLDDVDYPVMPLLPTLEEIPVREISRTPIVNRRTIQKNTAGSQGNETGDKQMTTNVQFQEQPLLDEEDTLRDNDNTSCEKNYTSSLIATIEATLTQLVNENKEFQRQVLRQLHVLNARIKEVMENQELFMKFKESSPVQANEIQAVTVHSQNMEIFPIDNDTNLMKIEEILKDQKEMHILAKELSRLGGTTIKDVTKRIMFQILSNETGQLYSWEGQKGKRKFKDLFLAKLVINAVRMNQNTANATEADIIKPMREWLVRAKFRQSSVVLNQAQEDTVGASKPI